MWKFLYESVEGTSHRASGTQCQDSSFVTPFIYETDKGLILVCSDGAGSAKESHRGSSLACRSITQSVMEFLEGGRTVAEATADDIRRWAQVAKDAIDAESETMHVLSRELACTLLVAVVGTSAAAFAQIGDGAIVISAGNEYRPVFWPQTGEYHNTTYFITDSEFEKNLQVEIRTEIISDIAMFSDGLQMLALNYASKAAHQPFFESRFALLRNTEDYQELIVPMRQWLDSVAVNQRTDDDKTLILATRATANGNEVL